MTHFLSYHAIVCYLGYFLITGSLRGLHGDTSCDVM